MQLLLIRLDGFLFPPAQNYSEKPVILFYGNQEVPQPLDFTKLAFYSYWLYTLFPEYNPTWPCVVCGVLGYELM